MKHAQHRSAGPPSLEVGPTVITGASSGIGAALAWEFARREPDRPLVLIARREPELRRLAERLADVHRGERRVLPLDLTESGSVDALADALLGGSHGPVHTLVNNAGFGAWGEFSGGDREQLAGMVDLNVRALVTASHWAVQQFLAHGRGRLLNVASTAAFQPGPWMAVYYATKAAVLSFTEAVHEELRGTGIQATALCPGPTASAFFVRAGVSGEELTRGPGPSMMAAEDVAGYGYKALVRGRAIAIPGWKNRLLAQGHRWLPRRAVCRLVRWFQSGRPEL